MTPGMFHSDTTSQALQKVAEDFKVKGDGTPRESRGEDEKDLQYWSLGRMMMHHRNLNGGFDKLFIAGLPAFRAIENMKCITGSGLTVPVEDYTGVELDAFKHQDMERFYREVNRRLPLYRKIGVDLQQGDILDVLPTLNKKFNVFDFDFMTTPNGWTLYEDRVPNDRVTIKKDQCWVFLKTEELDRLIQVIKDTRQEGPTAVYCNWAFGRQMSMEDWERLRQGILKRFQLNFEVDSYRWTWYRGNSRMCGLQVIFSKERDLKQKKAEKKESPIKGLKMHEVPIIDGERVKALRNKLGYTQQDLAEEVGVSQYTISCWERVWVGPLSLRPDAVEALISLLQECEC